MSKGIMMTEEQRRQLIELLKALGITMDNMVDGPSVELTDGILRVAPTYVFEVDEMTSKQVADLEALTGWRLRA